jgi:hypothetical protein
MPYFRILLACLSTCWWRHWRPLLSHFHENLRVFGTQTHVARAAVVRLIGGKEVVECRAAEGVFFRFGRRREAKQTFLVGGIGSSDRALKQSKRPVCPPNGTGHYQWKWREEGNVNRQPPKYVTLKAGNQKMAIWHWEIFLLKILHMSNTYYIFSFWICYPLFSTFVHLNLDCKIFVFWRTLWNFHVNLHLSKISYIFWNM